MNKVPQIQSELVPLSDQLQLRMSGNLQTGVATSRSHLGEYHKIKDGNNMYIKISPTQSDRTVSLISEAKDQQDESSISGGVPHSAIS
jgi:hypothetical protein